MVLTGSTAGLSNKPEDRDFRRRFRLFFALTKLFGRRSGNICLRVLFVGLRRPNMLIGGCGMMSMQCRKVAFPALTAESVVLLVFSAVIITVIAIKKPSVEG